MAAQLEHIAAAGRLAAVRVGDIPWTQPARVFPKHGFDLYDHRAVIVGTETATALLTDQHDVTKYVTLFAELERLAVFGEAADELLGRVAQEYRTLGR